MERFFRRPTETDPRCPSSVCVLTKHTRRADRLPAPLARHVTRETPAFARAGRTTEGSVGPRCFLVKGWFFEQLDQFAVRPSAGRCQRKLPGSVGSLPAKPAWICGVNMRITAGSDQSTCRRREVVSRETGLGDASGAARLLSACPSFSPWSQLLGSA